MARVRKAEDRVAVDGLCDYGGVVNRAMGPLLKGEVTGLTREGYGWRKRNLDDFVVLAKWATATEGGFMNIIEELKGNYDEAASLWSDYDAKLTGFRCQVKNDVSSLEASARKTTNAVQRMQKAYGDVISTLSSEEMLRATENAERLAAAMDALASLQSHKLTVAIVDNKLEAEK